MEHLSEQEIFRRNSRHQLQQMGIDPYPAALYPTNAFSVDIRADFDDNLEPKRQVCVAGRIMSRRIMGKASFVELQDSKGRIQIYIAGEDINTAEQPEMYNTVFKKLLDIGDFIGIKGFVFRTRMGEISVHAQELTVLSKSIRPLPIVKYKDNEAFDAFDDPEQRYRQRYVDLVVNDGIKDIFVKRTNIYRSMREYFDSQNYIEVETPILQPIPGGAAARPFITHHNALDIPLYLRIANELYLKRLIVGGFEGVYEFSKNFRNEGMDRTHNPEFTAMEIYVAYKDYNWMMEFTEKMVEKICLDVNGTTELKVGDNIISFKTPFKRVTMLDAIKEHTGYDLMGKTEEQIREIAQKLNIEVNDTMGKGKLIDEIFGEKCEGSYRTDRAFRVDGKRQRACQCLQRTERPHRPARTFPRAAASLREGRRRGYVYRYGLCPCTRIRYATHFGYGHRYGQTCDADDGTGGYTRGTVVPTDETGEETDRACRRRENGFRTAPKSRKDTSRRVERQDRAV